MTTATRTLTAVAAGRWPTPPAPPTLPADHVAVVRAVCHGCGRSPAAEAAGALAGHALGWTAAHLRVAGWAAELHSAPEIDRRRRRRARRPPDGHAVVVETLTGSVCDWHAHLRRTRAEAVSPGVWAMPCECAAGDGMVAA